jgi:3-dehydroquinate dehydratase-2
MMDKIIILNGPNLKLLGVREKEKYGELTLEYIEKNCKEFANKNDIDLSLFQSNIEGEIVEIIQKSRNEQHGLIINAGGYTHTSVAIHDSLKILKMPIIELHITNIYNREEFRHKSLISNIAKGIICGFGSDGYIMALQSMKKILKKNEN